MTGVLRNGEVRHRYTQGEWHVKIKAEIRTMLLLQAKEHQRSPTSLQKLYAGMELTLSQNCKEESGLPTPDPGLLVTRTVRKQIPLLNLPSWWYWLQQP